MKRFLCVHVQRFKVDFCEVVFYYGVAVLYEDSLMASIKTISWWIVTSIKDFPMTTKNNFTEVTIHEMGALPIRETSYLS